MTCAAILLAAGAGSRLGGRNKAALPLADGTFLDAVTRTARAAGVSDLVVVAGPPHGVETMALAAVARARVAWNPAPERGMISSIVVALEAIGDVDAALVWPVDHARVSIATVAAVVAAAGRARIVVPTWEGRGGHPTAFGASTFAELCASASARDVLAADATRVVRLSVEDAGVLRDVDTSEALA